MVSKDLLEMSGVVLEALPATTFKVKLENGHIVIAYLNGRMKKNNIRVLAGDNVRVEISPYDISKGRITYRNAGSQSLRSS